MNDVFASTLSGFSLTSPESLTGGFSLNDEKREFYIGLVSVNHSSTFTPSCDSLKCNLNLFSVGSSEGSVMLFTYLNDELKKFMVYTPLYQDSPSCCINIEMCNLQSDVFIITTHLNGLICIFSINNCTISRLFKLDNMIKQCVVVHNSLFLIDEFSHIHKLNFSDLSLYSLKCDIPEAVDHCFTVFHKDCYYLVIYSLLGDLRFYNLLEEQYYDSPPNIEATFEKLQINSGLVNSLNYFTIFHITDTCFQLFDLIGSVLGEHILEDGEEYCSYFIAKKEYICILTSKKRVLCFLNGIYVSECVFPSENYAYSVFYNEDNYFFPIISESHTISFKYSPRLKPKMNVDFAIKNDCGVDCLSVLFLKDDTIYLSFDTDVSHTFTGRNFTHVIHWGDKGVIATEEKAVLFFPNFKNGIPFHFHCSAHITSIKIINKHIIVFKHRIGVTVCFVHGAERDHRIISRFISLHGVFDCWLEAAHLVLRASHDRVLRYDLSTDVLFTSIPKSEVWEDRMSESLDDECRPAVMVDKRYFLRPLMIDLIALDSRVSKRLVYQILRVLFTCRELLRTNNRFGIDAFLDFDVAVTTTTTKGILIPLTNHINEIPVLSDIMCCVVCALINLYARFNSRVQKDMMLLCSTLPSQLLVDCSFEIASHSFSLISSMILTRVSAVVLAARDVLEIALCYVTGNQSDNSQVRHLANQLRLDAGEVPTLRHLVRHFLKADKDDDTFLSLDAMSKVVSSSLLLTTFFTFDHALTPLLYDQLDILHVMLLNFLKQSNFHSFAYMMMNIDNFIKNPFILNNLELFYSILLQISVNEKDNFDVFSAFHSMLILLKTFPEKSVKMYLKLIRKKDYNYQFKILLLKVLQYVLLNHIFDDNTMRHYFSTFWDICFYILSPDYILFSNEHLRKSCQNFLSKLVEYTPFLEFLLSEGTNAPEFLLVGIDKKRVNKFNIVTFRKARKYKLSSSATPSLIKAFNGGEEICVLQMNPLRMEFFYFERSLGVFNLGNVRTRIKNIVRSETMKGLYTLVDISNERHDVFIELPY
ncbi:hypothetical protein PCE1_002055 [Barthelona sp. PCE]